MPATTSSTKPAPDRIDLPLYLARIGLAGELPPTEATLRTLVAHHMAHIPFEAIDVLLGREVSLNAQAIDDKLLRQQRGGYCYEHSSVMQRVLQALGFVVERTLARVWVDHAPGKSDSAATHALLKVHCDNKLWLVDVGFGSFMPNAPLAWQPKQRQQSAHGIYRLSETRDGFMVESYHADKWQSLYEILDFPWQPADFEVANHYMSTHPDSHFRHRLMVAITTPTARYTLSGNRFKVAVVDGVDETRLLSLSEMHDTLAMRFGLNVEPSWKSLLARSVAAGA